MHQLFKFNGTFLIQKRHTISEGTGPEDAFRGERFLYAEMSLPRVPGNKATLQTNVPLTGTLTSVSNKV